MMNRDKKIIDELNRFRCLSRDDIIDLYFSHLKNPITCCNTVMKRLRLDGYVDVNADMQPYLYFPANSKMKRNSQKINHFLKIADFYKQVLNHEKPKHFIVEPKYGKRFMEPDIFMIWRKSPFFVEIQNTFYTQKTIESKMKRYETYYHSHEWEREPWQGSKPIFPNVVIITDNRYGIKSENFKLFQAQTFDDLLTQTTPLPSKPKPIKSNGGLKIKIN